MGTAASPENKIKTCSIWRALEVVGDKAVLLILESLWLGAQRFGELQERSGLLKALLSNRLQMLIRSGVLKKHNSKHDKRSVYYRLTPKGTDLFDTVMALYRWEKDWQTDRHKFELLHHSCGQIFTPESRCEHCREIYDLMDLQWHEGPGTGWTDNNYIRRRNLDHITTRHPLLLGGSVEILGDRWAALIMRSIITGNQKFDEIMDELGIGSAILSQRLKRLLDSGTINAEPYQFKPERNAYKLTPKGLDYYKIIIMLMIWGDKYYSSEKGPPIFLTHKACGQILNPIQCCSHCSERLNADSVEIRK